MNTQYIVYARCGHVNLNHYYLGKFIINAENGKDAAAICRNMPRVKHHHKFAILQVRKATEEDIQNVKEEHDNPYYSCQNVQEQREHWSEIEPNVMAEEMINRKTKNIDKDYRKAKALRDKKLTRNINWKDYLN